MPELPEVETTKRMLIASALIGQSITHATATVAKTVGGDIPAFTCQIIGRTFTAAGRRAKWLTLTLDHHTTIAIHLRMSGRLSIVPPTEPRTGYERVTLTLSDHRELRFHDTRKFGKFLITHAPAQLFRDYAPEPLSDHFSPQYVAQYLKHRQRMLKPLLLDQRALVAGLGNIYADEALWDAKLHPQQISSCVTKADAARLHRAIVTVIQRGIANLGTSLGDGLTNFALPNSQNQHAQNQDELKVFQRTGSQCFRCQSTIKRIVVGQRGTHICPKCQRVKAR